MLIIMIVCSIYNNIPLSRVMINIRDFLFEQVIFKDKYHKQLPMAMCLF